MESDIAGYDDVDVFVGVDVGKGEHHAVAIDRRGKRLFDRALPNDEARLRQLIGELKEHGRVLFVVDQPATIGALPIAVAHAEGVLVGYLPGLAMRRIADLHAGRGEDRRAGRGDHRRRPPGRCRTRCGRCSWPTSRSPSCRCSAASTTTSPGRSPRRATGSAAC